MRKKSNDLLVVAAGRNIIIRFNRPEIRSPLSIGVVSELSSLLDDIRTRPDVSRIVFTGVGNVFASGADLREIASLTAGGASEFAARGQRLMHRISTMRAETVAAVNGICFGGALDLALACGRRCASDAALFSHPGATLGIMTGWGGTQRLPRLIGETRAMEMFFTARRVDAAEALSIGLVDRVVVDPLAEALRTV